MVGEILIPPIPTEISVICQDIPKVILDYLLLIYKYTILWNSRFILLST